MARSRRTTRSRWTRSPAPPAPAARPSCAISGRRTNWPSPSSTGSGRVEEAARRVEPGDTVARRRARSSTATRRWATPTCACSSSRGASPPIDHLLAVGREQPPRLDRDRRSRPFLPRRGARREELVLTLYAATDVTVWKLLRRDLGRIARRDRSHHPQPRRGCHRARSTASRRTSHDDAPRSATCCRCGRAAAPSPPGLGVARRLIARGHAVHVLGDPTIRDQAEQAGCTFSPWTRAPHRTSLDPAQDLLEDWETTNPLAMLDAGPRPVHRRAGRGVRRRHRRRHRPRPSRRRRARLPALRRRSSPPRRPTCLWSPIVPQHLDAAEPGRARPRPGVPPRQGRPGRWRDAALRSRRQRPVRPRPAAAQRGPRRHAASPPLRSFYDQVLDTERILVLTSPSFDFASPSVPANVTYVGPILDDPAWAEPWTRPGRRPTGDDPLVLVGFSSTYQHQVPAAPAGRRCAVDACRCAGVVTSGPIARAPTR